jgi:hypothetical protein
MVALGLLTVIMMASLPVMLSVLRSAVTTRMDTQAKNLAQERLEQIRDLRFHVDRQNGPFLDVLDIYYTNATTGGGTTSVTAAGGVVTGTYVGTGGGTNGEPAAPFYRTSTGPLTGADDFSQRILTQFLTPEGTPVPKERFENVYNSQVVGRDQAPSLLIGVTVITEWVDAGRARSFSTSTRVTDGRPQQPLIQSQARAVAVDVSSTGADGATLQVQGGVVTIDGAQSSGSSVSGYAVGALARRTGDAEASGLTTQFSLPGTSPVASGSSSAQAGTGCSWFGFGATATGNVTGDVSQGLPKAPADVASGGRLSASILRSGTPACGQLSFDNTVGGGVVDSALATPMAGTPWVTVPDASSGGPGVQAAGYVDATDLTAPVQQTRAGANVSMTNGIVLFPNYAASGGSGLVSARLELASVACVSGTSSTLGTARGTYTLRLGWWGRQGVETEPRWHSATWTYDSSTGAAPVLQSGSDVWDPSQTRLEGELLLSDMVTAAVTPSTVTTGATNGLRGFPNGIFALTTAPTLDNETEPGFSSINVKLGQLTCVADDQR